jgi:hypothetical protein
MRRKTQFELGSQRLHSAPHNRYQHHFAQQWVAQQIAKKAEQQSATSPVSLPGQQHEWFSQNQHLRPMWSAPVIPIYNNRTNIDADYDKNRGKHSLDSPLEGPLASPLDGYHERIFKRGKWRMKRWRRRKSRLVERTAALEKILERFKAEEE